MEKEEQIIRKVLAGDTDSFRWIIEQYQRGVFHMIVGFVHNHAAAEDLTQEVFIAAFEKLSRHDSMRCRCHYGIDHAAQTKPADACL